MNSIEPVYAVLVFDYDIDGEPCCDCLGVFDSKEYADQFVSLQPDIYYHIWVTTTSLLRSVL